MKQNNSPFTIIKRDDVYELRNAFNTLIIASPDLKAVEQIENLHRTVKSLRDLITIKEDKENILQTRLSRVTIALGKAFDDFMDGPELGLGDEQLQNLSYVSQCIKKLEELTGVNKLKHPIEKKED